MLSLSILILNVLISGATGLVVLSKNFRSRINQLYFLISILLVLLSISNYLSLVYLGVHNNNVAIIFIRVVIAITVISIALFYITSYFLDKEEIRLTRFHKYFLSFSIFVAVLCMTNLIFNKTYYINGSTYELKVGYLVPLLLIQTIMGISVSLKLIINKIQIYKGKRKQQYQYILIGLLPALSLSFFTSFIMPYFFHNISLIVITPLYLVLLSAMIGLSIIFHGLFDIRFYVIRGLFYLLLLFGIDILLSVPALFAIKVIFNLNFDAVKFIIASLAILIVMVAYPHVINYFRRKTNKFFFRDFYDPAEFVSNFNNIVVSNFDIHTLLFKISNFLETTFKIADSEFYINNYDLDLSNFVETKNHRLRPDEINSLHDYLSTRRRVLLNLEVERTLKHHNKSFSINDDISLVIPLINYFEGKKKYLGFFILTHKESGQTYNGQDLRMISSISDVLIVAIQNLLHYEEIKQLNANLQERINEATAKLRKSNDKLRQLDESKDDFISMASHQLRTPLTSVKGYLSMVLEGDAGKISSTQKNMLNQAFFSAQRMVYLIADLLNVSRIKTGKFMIEAAKVNLAVMIDQEITQLQETSNARGIKLVYNRPDSFPDLMLDETKIRQVIMNFIDNAIYYTLKGGTVKIDILDLKSTIEFRVEDNGIGVTKSDQPHLFTKFYRAGNARKVRPDGTGLGLYMAKKVILAENGSVIFSSVEGKGSIFGFMLSKSKLAVVDNSN